MLTVIVFILILGVLILVHELGHFLTARMFKVKAEEFGFGYPPRIFGWVKNNEGKWEFVKRKDDASKYKNTVWSLNWFPLGGFVKIKGEDENALKETDSFASRPIWQRFIMLFAGVFMNFILCFVFLSLGFMSGIPSMVDDQPDTNLNVANQQIKIMSINPASPAEQAGLQIGDVFISINNQPINYIKDVQRELGSRNNQSTQLVILRGQEEKKIVVTPLAKNNTDTAVIGVGLVKTALVKYPWYQAIYKGATTTFSLTLAIVKAFGKIITDFFSGHKVEAEVAGPIGIAMLTGQVVKLGWVYVLQFAALLSINLGIINLLPIPALDGGRILFLAIEKVKGRPVSQKVEGAIHQIGFMLLMAIMVLVVFKDFRTYGSQIWQSIISFF